ncbi:MAG: hypothetical protein H0T78_07700 [Longispora sp.]|nr:hypothetical protein [Longispora sp. (in: high G+C Gram-positive bacteria)]
MASNATSDLSQQLGTDIKLEDLHPKTFIRKHLLSDEDQSIIRNQAESLRRQVDEPIRTPFEGLSAPTPAVTETPEPSNGRPRRFDLDAT